MNSRSWVQIGRKPNQYRKVGKVRTWWRSGVQLQIETTVQSRLRTRTNASGTRGSPAGGHCGKAFEQMHSIIAWMTIWKSSRKAATIAA